MAANVVIPYCSPLLHGCRRTWPIPPEAPATTVDKSVSILGELHLTLMLTCFHREGLKK